MIAKQPPPIIDTFDDVQVRVKKVIILKRGDKFADFTDIVMDGMEVSHRQCSDCTIISFKHGWLYGTIADTSEHSELEEHCEELSVELQHELIAELKLTDVNSTIELIWALVDQKSLDDKVYEKVVE